MSDQIRLCDECGKLPRAVFVQLEGRYRLVCPSCSAKNRHTQVEQWVDTKDPDNNDLINEAA